MWGMMAEVPDCWLLLQAKLMLTGGIVFFFLLHHLRGFRFGADHFISEPNTGPWGNFGVSHPMRDLYTLQATAPGREGRSGQGEGAHAWCL